ncbi:uncharacterized protein LOC110117687 [Ceratitis capitata]|uniref:uncharacterized protein LOC110117687 n=1 Tax=Ceratitis capitata TaxID=7213 RepID=UPI000A0F537A|nr:uncharacterized protein LOC110117687 [Ceratitis capitata]
MAPACWVSEPTLTFSLSQNRQLPTMATGRYSTPPAMVSPTQFLPDNVATPSGNTMAPSSNAHDEQGTTIVHLAHRPRNQAVYQKLQLERLEEEMRIQQQFIFFVDPDESPLFTNSFENSTAVAGYTYAENLKRLKACLKGKAREMVKSKLFMPSMVPEIIKTLKMCFGRPEYILERSVNRTRALPPV